MSEIRLALCALPLVLAACSSTSTEKSVSATANWMEPMEQHKGIVGGAGEWEGTLTMFGEHATPQPIPAKETVEAVGPFWIQTTFRCDFGGMPYHGTGCVGYDPAAKKYVGTWIDSTRSYFSWMEGEMDASGKLVMHWTAPDEMTGKPTKHRSESTETANGRTMTFYRGEGAGEKTMVIEMRKK
jgi:hypothetical protein